MRSLRREAGELLESFKEEMEQISIVNAFYNVNRSLQVFFQCKIYLTSKRMRNIRTYIKFRTLSNDIRNNQNKEAR